MKEPKPKPRQGVFTAERRPKDDDKTTPAAGKKMEGRKPEGRKQGVEGRSPTAQREEGGQTKDPEGSNDKLV